MSSNGRTTDFGSVYSGSSPGVPAEIRTSKDNLDLVTILLKKKLSDSGSNPGPTAKSIRHGSDYNKCSLLSDSGSSPGVHDTQAKGVCHRVV